MEGVPGKSLTAAEPLVPPPLIWVGSPNSWQSPVERHPLAIVLHTMSGTLLGTDSWFRNPASEVSAHFGVGLDGAIHQYVDVKDVAWANGKLESGERWTARFGPGNPNLLTVSIETEDNGDPERVAVTDEQYESVLKLGRYLVARFPSITTLATHASISPRTRAGCPGPRWVASGRFEALARELGLKTLL